MYNDKSKLSFENSSLSLSVPSGTISEVQSVVIGCSETRALAGIYELEKLQPVAFITMPGVNLNGSGQDGLRFLETILTLTKEVQHIVVCLHSGCAYEPSFNRVAQLDLPSSDRIRPYDAGSINPLFSLQNALTLQLCAVADLLKKNPGSSARKIVLHGWLFEPEIDWVSFFDLETGLLLPLNAHTELCT